VQNFDAGDVLDLRGLDLDFDALMANASDVNGDVVLNLGAQQITLRGLGTSSLTADHFLV
jgi:hypothetical protein